ncbi:Modulator of FtsH protease HflK [Raoultella terrigena]|uniref:Modulator of FtsH protease HflK n=1 Tax=Raoultella terrigena TaxID=577 RepID=A0A4U9D687_RAOTE|nr:Modulator of FtsH protease HflK [Raoultella terrigena]
MGGRIVGIVAAAAVIIWAASGFYTIKEAERGVVTRFGKFSHLVSRVLTGSQPLSITFRQSTLNRYVNWRLLASC